MPEELRPITRPETARTVVAEKRGKYTFLSMVTDDGSSTQCFFDDGDLSHPVGMTGSGVTATSPPPRELAPDEIEMNGQGMSGGPEGSYAFTDGRAGADVTGVTIHSGGTTVQATVSNGHYAAWWPAELPENPNAVEPRISFEVTLADGTVKEPTMPEWYGPDAAPDGVARVSTGGGVGEDGQEVSTVSGELGADVTAVALVVGGREVPATVTDGTFVVELPGTLEGAEPTLRLTLRDGTVREEPLPTTAGTEVSAQHAD